MFAKTIAFSGLAALASAHILMTNPVPYGASSLNNSPLDASGSDFPCKQRPGVYDAEGASNVYPQGSTQQLSFKGTAVHGGGSCQVSVTTDRQPDANSVWKVIKSIEGGCPSRGAAGNIGNDPNSPVPDTYDFEIPSDLPAGEYSLAWTWFNKIGNREMYMNCAPITVTGSGGDVSTFNALPDMFVANINDCRVSEGNDVQFPNPGAFVVQENGPTNVFAAPQGACATGSSGSPPKDPEPVEPSEPTETPQPPQVTDAPETPQPTGLPGNVFITVSSSPEPTQVNPPAEPTQVTPPAEPTEVAPPTKPTEVAPPTKPTEPATPPTEPTEPATPPAAPVTGGQSGPCTNEGAWNCIGGNSFQRCASGAWSAVQQLARGNSCEEGVSDSLTLVAKRFFPRRPSGAMV